MFSFWDRVVVIMAGLWDGRSLALCPVAAEVFSSPERPGRVWVSAVKWTCSAVDPLPSGAEDRHG